MGQKQFINNIDELSKSEKIDTDLKLGQTPSINNEENPIDDEFEVDFWVTIQSYMLEVLIYNPYSFEPGFHEQTPVVIKNFLEYLLRAKVCPEYDCDIINSIELCKIAQPELKNIEKLAKILPDKFSKACSIKFGGYYYDYFKNAKDNDDNPWFNLKNLENTIELEKNESDNLTLSMVKNKIKLDQAICGDMVVYEIIKEPSNFIIEELKSDYSLIKVKPFIHESLSCNYNKSLNDLEIGVEINQDRQKWPISIDLYINTKYLEYIFIDMVISAHFYRLSNNVWYFDFIQRLMPSFQFFNKPEVN